MQSGNYECEIFDKDNDYALVKSWFDAWDYPMMPAEFLPKIGIVASIDGVKSSCIWIFQTDSKICYYDGLISDKGIDRNKMDGCLDYLIKAANIFAHNQGYQIAVYHASREKILNRFLNIGFKAGDTGLTNIAMEV